MTALKVRIGIAEVNRVVDLEIDDAAEFESTVESAFAEGAQVFWVEDVSGQRVGVPVNKIAFVEIEQAEGRHRVGFG